MLIQLMPQKEDTQHRVGHIVGFSSYLLFEYLIVTYIKHWGLFCLLRITNPTAFLSGCSLPRHPSYYSRGHLFIFTAVLTIEFLLQDRP